MVTVGPVEVRVRMRVVMMIAAAVGMFMGMGMSIVTSGLRNLHLLANRLAPALLLGALLLARFRGLATIARA